VSDAYQSRAGDSHEGVAAAGAREGGVVGGVVEGVEGGELGGEVEAGDDDEFVVA